MPRRQFLADIQATADLRIPGIGSIERGPDDDVLISFIPATGPPIEIVMMAQPGMPSDEMCPRCKREGDQRWGMDGHPRVSLIGSVEASQIKHVG